MPSFQQNKPVLIPASAHFDEAVTIFKNGGIIVYPTETFYALGADPFNPAAVKRVFSLKGRPVNMPLSLIVKDAAMLNRVTHDVTPVARRLIAAFWPGPLTIIFEAHKYLLPELTAGTGSIAVRVSSDPVCNRLLEALDAPVTATSANPMGKPPASDTLAVEEYFNGEVDVIIDGGRLKDALGSTFVDCRGQAPVIVRHGMISEADVMRASRM